MRTQKPVETVSCQEIKKTRLGLLTQEDAKILLATQGSNPVRPGKVKRCRVEEGERKDRQTRSAVLTGKTVSRWANNYTTKKREQDRQGDGKHRFARVCWAVKFSDTRGCNCK